MNVIEALFISLGIDDSDYKKKQKGIEASLKKMGETSDKQTKLIAESAKKAAAGFKLLKIEVLGAIAAYGLGDGIKGFIESNIRGNAALGRTAANLRMNTSELKAWGYAAESVGGKAEDAVSTMQSVAKAIAETRLNGRSSLILASNKYGAGITGKDTAEEALQKINRVVYEKAQKYGPQIGLAIANAFGVDNPAMQQLMLRGPDQLRQLVAHYRKYTGHTDSKDAIALQGTMTDIRAAVGNLRDDLFSKMAPAMEVFAKRFEAFLDRITPKLEALAERLGKWLDGINWDKVVKKVEEFFEKLQQVAQALGGVKGILIEIAAIKVFGWMASIAGWVIQLRALTTALTAARAAAAGGAVAEAAEGAAAGTGVGLAAKAVPLATRLSMWALPIWALFHSESTGGKRRADGTYEDEVSSAQLAATAEAARAMEAKHRAQAMAYFTSHGWTPQQAAGIVANLTAESGLRTNASGDNGQAYGIAQWHKDRQRAFERFTGHSIQGSTLAEQLAFVNHELQTSEKRAGIWLKRAGNAYAAGSLVSLMYERPAGGQVEAERRGSMAQQMVNAYVGAHRASAAKTANNTTTVTLNGGITVNTKATDANGIAKGMQKAVRNHPLIAANATVLA